MSIGSGTLGVIRGFGLMPGGAYEKDISGGGGGGGRLLELGIPGIGGGGGIEAFGGSGGGTGIFDVSFSNPVPSAESS